MNKKNIRTISIIKASTLLLRLKALNYTSNIKRLSRILA